MQNSPARRKALPKGQWRPWIIAALDLARAKGLHLPIVCNTGGYETVESVHAWRGFIDIWLADLKWFWANIQVLCKRYDRIPFVYYTIYDMECGIL